LSRKPPHRTARAQAARPRGERNLLGRCPCHHGEVYITDDGRHAAPPGQSCLEVVLQAILVALLLLPVLLLLFWLYLSR
jgi:hypothetical protein